MNELEDRYFDWLKQMAMGQDRSYDSLLEFLHNKPYIYTLPMDKNREKDGVELRFTFGTHNGIEPEDILSGLGAVGGCSMLEMMVGLACRCENQIMVYMEEGAQPERWFKVMITNLGLKEFDNDHFDVEKVESIVDCFINRQYTYNGDGSLFSVCNPRHDMRETDLWYQAMWYFTENYINEEELL